MNAIVGREHFSRPATRDKRSPSADLLPAHDNKALLRAERAIAQKYVGGRLWGVVVLGLGNFFLWAALFPLTMFDIIPLWLAFIIATLSITVCYVPSHEAQHSNIAREGEKLRWVNELLGHLSTIPLILPYRMTRIMHLQHHMHVNDPERDPDYPDAARNAFHAIIKTIVNRQPRSTGTINHYKRVLTELNSPAARTAQKDTAIAQLASMAFFFIMAWSGYPLVIALVWWLPRHIALSYIRFYLSWAPHHPRVETGRYTNTRAFRSRLGHIASMGMQYHIVHHLYPNIPTHRTRAAYWEMRPILVARGCDLGEL
ncbi:fatty acid desaturase [Rhizorhapis sp. SPR117]|uniref:fatty acid desaturase n=1 Tax=Rhizorhapis sp. SPR117 TaxID=2912611 RepID=UPI001F027337|nr:fatty acid desaturase [Rhizorhapis sp. SPR117]